MVTEKLSNGRISENRNIPDVEWRTGLHKWVLANQRMAAALKAKGYAYRCVFAEAAGHTDSRVARQTLPGALEWLWQRYRSNEWVVHAHVTVPRPAPKISTRASCAYVRGFLCNQQTPLENIFRRPR